MLIRITPEMFINEKYGCCTIQNVRREIFETQKFKDKYPWRINYRDKINCLLNSNVQGSQEVSLYFETIDSLCQSGAINQTNGRDFDLSYTDKWLLAGALAHQYKITTGDNEIKIMGRQEFSREFKGDISPLGMVNNWIKDGILLKDEKLFEIISDWAHLGEHPQPTRQKSIFKRLTGQKYLGS